MWDRCTLTVRGAMNSRRAMASFRSPSLTRRTTSRSAGVRLARGTGTLTCGGQGFALRPNDVAAIPAWTWHQLIAADDDLILFRVTDRPIHDAFGLLRPRKPTARLPRPPPAGRDRIARRYADLGCWR